MTFSYAPDLHQDFPELITYVREVGSVKRLGDVTGVASGFLTTARARLDGHNESEFPEIQAWRRAFGKMGLKPTQYRCASESLRRRLRLEGALPSIHPLVNLCNAASMAFAIPIAVFDLEKVEGALQVRRATGAETYETFAGDIEHPNPGEIIFADEADQAHARRWTNRQSGLSAIRPHTERVLIVAEAMHETAKNDIARLGEALERAFREVRLAD